jgi:hypothetical protein
LKLHARSATSSTETVEGGTDAEVGGTTRPARADLSERRMRDLGAHRTAALQAALVRSRQVALAVLVHPMAETVFGRHGHGKSCVTTHVCGDGTLASLASAFADSPAVAVPSQAEANRGDRMPDVQRRSSFGCSRSRSRFCSTCGVLHRAQRQCHRRARRIPRRPSAPTSAMR